MKDDTLAMELLKEQRTNAKRWFIAFIVVLGLWFATIGGFITYLSIPSEVSETSISQHSDNDGSNNVVGGDYNGGETEDNKNSN